MTAMIVTENAKAKVVKYPNPPILEVICEIHFALPASLNQEALARMQPRWKLKYPKQQIVTARSVELQFSVDKMQADSKEIGHKLVARSDDEKHLAQLGPSFLAVNRLRPYVGWEEEFRDTILARFEEVREEYGLSLIQRIGLRYINKIDLPQSPLRWADWFQVSIPVPRTVSQEGGMFQSHFRQQLAPDLECMLNFGTLVQAPQSVTSVILDIDVVWRGSIRASDVPGQLEAVHRPHRDLFEAYLLDSTRKLFHLT